MRTFTFTKNFNKYSFVEYSNTDTQSTRANVIDKWGYSDNTDIPEDFHNYVLEQFEKYDRRHKKNTSLSASFYIRPDKKECDLIITDIRFVDTCVDTFNIEIA